MGHHRASGYDPEKWKPVFRKIMLKQKDKIMIRFNRMMI